MRYEERELYRLHGTLPVHRRRVADAIAIVRRALATHAGTWAVSLSGGKDSTALLSVAIEAGWRGPVLHLCAANGMSANLRRCLALADRYGCVLHRVESRSSDEVMEAVGRACLHPATAEEKALVNAFLRNWAWRANELVARQGWAGVMMGMRADESRARRLNVATHGVMYVTEDRSGATALPLSRWSARDVWARHVAHDLPYAPKYDEAEDRERARSSEVVFFAAEAAWRYGQGAEIRRTDPALWARLTTRWPELARWG